MRTGSALSFPLLPQTRGARVDLVSEDEVDAVLGPELAGGAGDALVVEGAGDFQHPGAGLGQVEDALDHQWAASGSSSRVGRFLAPSGTMIRL